MKRFACLPPLVIRRQSLVAAAVALAAACAVAADAGYTLGVPGAPVLRNASNAAANQWLSANPNYPAMAVVAPGAAGAMSAFDVAGEDPVRLAASEAGFPLERTKPEYYLGDLVEPPDGVDWSATYERFVDDANTDFLFDPADRRVYATHGGAVRFTWVYEDGTETEMSYVVSSSCSGRPRRIYWTDYPYNGPAIDLSGKYVKFFGPDELLTPVYGVYTNIAAGISQVLTNRIVQGLVVDPTTKMLNAYGELQGQVVMAYYDTGTFERMLHVQTVEICRPVVNRMPGEIGRALRPDGRGYGTVGLIARPTAVQATDNRGDWYYQHQGMYSYSPKHGDVFPLRPTMDSPWNMEVYWMETDEMLVEWPFELDQYACDWPEDATIFVRGGDSGDPGRPIYVPSDYSATLMPYQEPEGHARAVESDGTFRTLGEGWSLLKVEADDDIWFFPMHSILRSNPDYFTLAPQDIRVGHELMLRGGTVAGTAAGFHPICDPDSPGYIYASASDPVWNASIYADPMPANATSTGDSAAAAAGAADTNSYASVVYAVRPGTVEVWWNTVIREEGMPSPLEVPTLPQVYSARWPVPGERPQIVIASQLGSASESVFSQDAAIYLSTTNASAALPSRNYFSDAFGGTLMFWARVLDPVAEQNGSDIVSLALDDSGDLPSGYIRFTLGDGSLGWSIGDSARLNIGAKAFPKDDEWHHVAIAIATNCTATIYLDGVASGDQPASDVLADILAGSVSGAIGKPAMLPSVEGARQGVSIGEVLLWNRALAAEEIADEMLKTHASPPDGITGSFVFVEGVDLAVTGTDERIFIDKRLGTICTAVECLIDENGPPALGPGLISPDEGTVPRVYAQNNPASTGYNPNEEHAIVQAGSGGYVAWALRSDLNTDTSSAPGVLVEYVSGGRKAMQWFDVALTNAFYPELAADCVAGKAFPGPHPIDFFDDPWLPEDTWDEPSATSPVHRDRKGQLWARAAGTATMRMYYPMQAGFAFPSLDAGTWPKIGEPVPWLSLLDGASGSDPLVARPAAWTWRVSWPDEVPEMEIGRTLTKAASGLPEVWNAGSVAVVWPPTDAARSATAVLFDPTVAQTSGFPKSTYDTVAAAVADLGIKQGAGGNATLRKGRWTFDGLPPNLSSRFYLDTTADVTRCLKLEGEMEDNPGGVSLLHVNVLSASERAALSALLDDTASAAGRDAWHDAIKALATAPVLPSPHVAVSAAEDRVDYSPRDHYALFSMGATNYVTLIENDSENELMGVAEGDPISMHLLKVVPTYYVGRVVTREDPLNLLSQQLSVIYAEAFAGEPDDYVFEWRSCRPHLDGSVPTDFDGEYTPKFEPSSGLTRFVIGAQGDTLANMVNTYYAVRYRAASENSPSYAAMGYEWSEWSDPPALAEGWVQRVLNNVTPFAQRMRDLAENEVETSISMLRQAGAPYEGDVALSQDNLSSVGLIQLYETLLSKAESMSLALGIDDADANKQLQLAVARLADLYAVLGDEAWTDALNPTIGFGSNFNTTSMTGLELDYGSLSSALFCFDNQVPTLLDEELALLRGRSGENAPSTKLSPYYNRLPWNLSKSPVGGEVAYIINYDISSDGLGIIDERDAATMFPQGHGDAYGHYLSALSGYYRLLRNPFFTWGAPAMGEMVVADAVLNVDYYDEAKFAKAAYDVAKVALLVVDRTARKAIRDNGGAPGAGYLDSDPSRAFGYGEWGSRGGFGALANWAVGNALLAEAPAPAAYWRYSFDGADSTVVGYLGDEVASAISATEPWTVEFQLVPGEVEGSDATPGDRPVLSFRDEDNALSFFRDPSTGDISLKVYGLVSDTSVIHSRYWFYTNAVSSAEDDFKDAAELAQSFGDWRYRCLFVGGYEAPAAFPEGYDFADFETDPPEFDGWTCVREFATEDDAGNPIVSPGLVTWDYEETVYIPSGEPKIAAVIGTAPANEDTLVVVRHDGGIAAEALLMDASGAVVSSVRIPLQQAFSLAPGSATIGGGYVGEIGEVRVWDDEMRTEEELRSKRGFVSPYADGLALYLRPIAQARTQTILDQASPGIVWYVSGGSWISSTSSGMSIDFNDEGLKRIDRSTVPELNALAGIVPAIQKKVDQMDAGMGPLGLASGAIPFDLTPIGTGEDEMSHYEQIRERAGTALANARRSLDRAQFYGSRIRLLQEAQVWQDQLVDTMELETKNKLIEYFGYPYEGDIGPGGSYPQGYDGPDLLHYAWMEPVQFGLGATEDVKSVTTNLYFRDVAKFRDKLAILLPNFLATVDFMTVTYEKSATGIILKPANIAGKRLACGQIQDKMGEFLIAYRNLNGKLSEWEMENDHFEYLVGRIRRDAVFYELQRAVKEARFVYEQISAVTEAALKTAIINLELAIGLSDDAMKTVIGATPRVVGAGMTVNTDPAAIVAASVGPGDMTYKTAAQGSLAAAKIGLVERTAGDIIFDVAEEAFELLIDQMGTFDGYYDTVYDSAFAVMGKAKECRDAYVELLAAECAVETVVAEAARIIDERTLARQQASDQLTKARYNEMFFRLARNNALSRYDAQFNLAQKYAWLAAQAYDYETGLLSSDPASGEAFLARIVGARTLGEFDDDGEPLVSSDDVKGDGGLAAILAEMDENWLVLKPRLGINNPQRYATWFSLRHELFRIYEDERGDKAWRTALEKCWVEDLRSVPEFSHYCQPLAGSEASAEPGLVIPFPTMIAFGKNFFGESLAGGDSTLDPTWFSTRIAGAGIHFDGYNQPLNGYEGTPPLSRTPSAYLVPVGEDRMRAPGDAGMVIGWRVVDQTIPAPYAIGSTQLDDPDWTPLFDGATGGNDLGARIRRHPSFRAYAGAAGEDPSDEELDCTRLVGRSAWNTRWLLIIPAGSLGADRETALATFVRGADLNRDGKPDVSPVRDIKLGLRTYSRSGN